MTIVYVPEYVITGWFDDNGYRKLSWFSRDLTDGVPIKLDIFVGAFFDDDDVVFLLDGGPGTPISQLPDRFPPTSGIWVELLAGFFDDKDLIYTPMTVRALVASDKMLKNEVRRIR
jgi:hypothetical protein